MSKLNFPTIMDAAYASPIAKLRVELQKIASFLEKSPKAALDVANTIMPLNALLGVVAALLGGSTSVLTAGSATASGTIEGANGSITGVRLAGTSTVVTSGFKTPSITVTGTGDFATITVVDGAITEITLSAS